ncbi:hypothetical protein [Chryseobacterium vietnamense]
MKTVDYISPAHKAQLLTY